MRMSGHRAGESRTDTQLARKLQFPLSRSRLRAPREDCQMSRSTFIALGFSSALVLAATSTTTAVVGAAFMRSLQQTDKTLQDRIDYRMETSPMLKKYNIHVKVDASVAWLSGDVATETQKVEATRLAKIDGVSKVQNDLKVSPNADVSVADRIKKGLNKTGEAITDSWITTKVHWFFMGEDLLKGSDINVDTADHVVTLKGTVASTAGRARAVQLAKETDGVKRVVDQLTIK